MVGSDYDHDGLRKNGYNGCASDEAMVSGNSLNILVTIAMK